MFDKFCIEGIGYDAGLQPLRDIGNVRKYLKFLQNVAYIMFEKNKLSLKKDEYYVPELDSQGERISIIEFPVKPFFESNGYNIEFIHKSICDYFISEYFFSFLGEALNVYINKEELAEILGNMFITPNRLEPDVLIYLRYKIKNSDLNYKFDVIDDAFQLMLINGMTYYIKEHPRNIMRCEINIFVNMLDILHLWERDFWRFHKSIHSNYFLYNMKYGINLVKAQFAGVHLNCARLHGADLREANLENTDLSDADLEGANLEGANLRGAILFDCLLGGAKLTNLDLRETNLIRVDLGGIRTIEADLKGAILNEEQVSYLALRYNLQGVKVYIETTRDIVEYEEYCKNNKK